MRTLILVVLMISGAMLKAQSEKLEIKEERKGNSITFFAKSYTRELLEVEFDIEGKGFVSNKELPMKFSISNMQKKEIATITRVPGENLEYTVNYTYGNSLPANIKPKEKIDMTPKETPQADLSEEELKSGLVLFTQKTCGRCIYATNFLLENNIPFRQLDVNTNKANSHLMWKILVDAGFNEKSIQMPVILVDGKWAKNTADIQTYMNTLLPENKE